jgi:parvulin-like peptidyl-prolyl isomerase
VALIMENSILCIRLLLLWGLLSNLIVAAHAETVILSKGEVEINFEEAFAYSLKHTNPNAYEASLTKPQATFRVLQNLYVLKRVARQVEDEGLISQGDSRYLREDLYRRALLERYIDHNILARMEQIDWEGLAKAEFALRKSEFVSPAKVRAEHLLVSIEGIPFDTFVSTVKAVQKGLAEEIDFSLLISQYSDDPSSAENGGDLGFFSRQRMQPAFSDAAFSLEQLGDITGPIMTIYGAHFIRLVDRKEEQALSFERVKEALIQELKGSTTARLREELLSEIREEIEPELATIDESEMVSSFLKAYDQRQGANED